MAGWQAQGCYATIQQCLGYRLELAAAEMSTVARPGGVFRVRLEVRNTGWAAPVNPRTLRIVLSNGQVLHQASTKISVTAWQPGETYHYEPAFRVPATLNGTYVIETALPDPHPRLANDPRYAMRFASELPWAQGRHQLGMVTVTAEASGDTDPQASRFELLDAN